MNDNSAAQAVEEYGASDFTESVDGSRRSSGDVSLATLPLQNGVTAPSLPLDPLQYQIHKAVYENNFKLLTKLVKQKDADLERKDMHGKRRRMPILSLLFTMNAIYMP